MIIMFVDASNVVKWDISRWIAQMQNQMEMFFWMERIRFRDVEKSTKLRCFRCNSFDHLKASCPLYKIEKDKASAKALSIGKASTSNAEKNNGSSKIEDLRFDEKTKKNIQGVIQHIANTWKFELAGESGLVNPLLDEDDDDET